MSLLEVRDLDVHYGDFQALHGDLADARGGQHARGHRRQRRGQVDAAQGDRRAVPGRRRGQVLLDGRPVQAAAAAPAGAARASSLTPEGRRLFPEMTVEENLLVGAQPGAHGPWDLQAVCALFPLVAERLDRTGREPVRRRAAGRRDRPRAHGQPAAAAARRGVARARAASWCSSSTPRCRRWSPRGTTVLVVEQDVGHALARRRPRAVPARGPDRARGRGRRTCGRDQVAAAYFGTEVLA